MPEQTVSILSWPEQSARLEHTFKLDKPCPVSISFDPAPASVMLSSDPQRPLQVSMNMLLAAREPVPLCISVCEPICARSDYTIGIEVFGNPFASITVRGTTRLFACRDDVPPPTPVPG